MSETLFCSFCAEYLTNDILLDHLERIHVGTHDEPLYRLSCGHCEYRSSERKRYDMIEHCFRMKHNFMSVQLDWSGFVENETLRIKSVIGAGVELLEENQSDKQHSESRVSLDEPERRTEPSTIWPASREESSDDLDTSSGSDSGDYTRIPDYSAIKAEGPKIEKMTTSEDAECLTESKISLDKKHESNICEVRKPADSVMEDKLPKIKEIPISEGIKSSKGISNDKNHESDYRVDILAESKSESNTLPQSCHAAPQRKTRSESKHTCEICQRELFCANFSKKMSLTKHTISHTNLKFFQCRDCDKELRTISHVAVHKRDKGCKSRPRPTITEMKRSALREQLSCSFPGIDFETMLSSSTFIGNSNKEARFLDPSYGFKNRSQPAGNWDCTMCATNGLRGASPAILHAISHSGLKPYQCKACLKLLASSPAFSVHFRSCKSKEKNFPPGCQVILSEDDMSRITKLLWRGFPSINWNEKLKPGTTIAGITF